MCEILLATTILEHPKPGTVYTSWLVHLKYVICHMSGTKQLFINHYFFWLTQIRQSNLSLLFEMLNLVGQGCYKHILWSKTIILMSLARWKYYFERWGESLSLNRLWSGLKKLYLIITCLSKFSVTIWYLAVIEWGWVGCYPLRLKASAEGK